MQRMLTAVTSLEFIYHPEYSARIEIAIQPRGRAALIDISRQIYHAY
jgi:hypothetical protein